MIFGPVSPVKGRRHVKAVVAWVVLLGMSVCFFGAAETAATAADETAPMPWVIQGVGEAKALSPSPFTDASVLRHQEVVVDAAMLDVCISSKTQDDNIVGLSFFDDVVFQVELEASNRDIQGVRTYSGRILGKEHGYFMLSVNAAGQILARIDIFDDVMRYIVARDMVSDVMLVSEQKIENEPAASHADIRIPPYDKDDSEIPPVVPAAGSRATFDVLVAYTPAAKAWAQSSLTSIDNVIAQAIERGTQTLQDSQVNARLRLVHAVEVAYTESGSPDTDLERLTFTTAYDPDNRDPAGVMDDVHGLRDQYGADFVVLLNSGNIGLGWLLTQTAGDPRYAFTLVPVQGAEYILIHEIGHNLGCHHSRNQSSQPAGVEGGLFVYSTGWRWMGSNNRGYASIMTYPENDTRVPLFSNPDVSFAGAPSGSYTGQYSPADNARSIREIQAVTASYRPTVVSDTDEEAGYENADEPDSDEVWYVDVSVTSTLQDGRSWATAFKNLQQAIGSAGVGSEIWVADGDYTQSGTTPVATMKEGVNIYGGFKGDEERRIDRNVEMNTARIVGARDRVCVVGASSAVLDGFFLDTGGMVNEGKSALIVRNCRFENCLVGILNTNSAVSVRASRFKKNVDGISSSGGDPEILRCSFTDNTSIAVINNGASTVKMEDCVLVRNLSGAISNTNVTPTINNCRFESNRSVRGGAIYSNATSSLQITNSQFLRNAANGDGGAIFGGVVAMTNVSFVENTSTRDGGAVTGLGGASKISRCRFVRNEAKRDGGALLLTTNVAIENCLVYGNAAANAGAGISVSDSAPTIWNTTFARNFGSALHNMTAASNTVVTNCIIWGNNDGILSAENSKPVITYSNVQINQGTVQGTGNINKDPLFRNLPIGDLYLTAASPCINVGVVDGPSVDIGDVDRDETPDMGAWEYVGDTGGDSGEGPADDPNEGEGEGEGEEEDEPAADFTVRSRVRDTEALLPLHDWVPLFRFSMSYGEDDYAPRYLSKLVYELRNDPDKDPERDYAVRKGLYYTDLLEFAVFRDYYCDGDCEEADEPIYGNLDYYDDLLFSWTNDGDPVATRDGLRYEMNLIGNGTPANPEYPLATAPQIDDALPDGNVYIVAVRTSATWRSQLSLGCAVLNAEMIDPRTGVMPVKVDDDGKVEVIDSYSPNFYDGETLKAEQYYSSSFGVYDPSGGEFLPVSGLGAIDDIPRPNFWQHTPYLSMPLSELSRPRWNKPQQLMSIAAGEFMDIRNLVPLDSWTSVLGINVHSSRSYKVGDVKQASLLELNVVLTDVGGDPYGAEGNGGFNPRNGLKPVLAGRSQDSLTVGSHVVHNGIWVYRDNGNGIFDPPTPQLGGGVTFNGDLPIAPLLSDYQWEYIPLPPGGGDPWWKIKLALYSNDKHYQEGLVPKTPNNNLTLSDEGVVDIGSEWSYDFFVVVRADSGHKDVSLQATSSPGATYGAEFRAFIEPRRFDTLKNTWEGGIYVTSQIPSPLSLVYEGYPPWQDDPRWLPTEPWWPERTHNSTTVKPFRVGLEVCDLVHTYTTRNLLPTMIPDFTFFPTTLIDTDLDLYILDMGYSPINNRIQASPFAAWLDPFQLNMLRFQNGHIPDIYSLVSWEVGLTGSMFGETYRLLNTWWSITQFAFETAPFFNAYLDLPPNGPRSSAYPAPPQPPLVPDYSTWPGQLKPGQYPALSDWPPQYAQARLLKQKIESNSKHTAMIGVNVAGSADPVVNEEGNSVTMAELYVAFWGPGFSPDMLKPLDPKNDDNTSLDSGVLLWENAGESGAGFPVPVTFFNTQEVEYYGNTPLPMMHQIVPVTKVSWSSASELIDISGDGIPDDMDGDGIVDDRDKAWVLAFRPRNQWEVPETDNPGDAGAGLDLFVSVSTSENLSRFQSFRAVIPATLPARAANRRRAGIQFYPPVNTGPRAYRKAHGEEDNVTTYYGNDMIEANVPMRITDMTKLGADIYIGGTPVPVLGLDISTNRENGTLLEGDTGIGYAGGFRVQGAKWAADMYAGHFLIDERYESYEITANTSDTLRLLSGTPRNGAWRIVQEPTFLEETTVEFYQEGTHANFSPLTDLLPLDLDQRISGVALYRDNDNHPDNRNGLFDPDIDIPLILDTAPYFSGRTAEETKVRFVFSTPGTSDFPRPRKEQARNRQWVPDTFGSAVADDEQGPEFFVVLRAALDMQLGDNLRVGIVSWGPNTPTEPDPHIWAVLPGEERHDYLRYREFPWAERGVGFITYFKEPPLSYSLNGYTATQRPDTSGFNWIRTHSAQKRRSGVITARNRPLGPNSLVIESASKTRLPVQTLPGQSFNLIIYGKNFGDNPMVALSDYDVMVNAAKGDAVSISISTRADVVPQEPITVVIRNAKTGDEASRSDLFSLTSDISAYGPKIRGVVPGKGRKNDFPVVVEGDNFFSPKNLEVRFGGTLMPILHVAADGTAITVGFPVGGLPTPGMLDVSVSGIGKNSGQDILMNGFEYINPEARPKLRLLGCAPASGSSGAYGSDVLLALALIGVLVGARAMRKA